MTAGMTAAGQGRGGAPAAASRRGGLAPGRRTWPALLSVALHAGALAGVLLLLDRTPPRDPDRERGVALIWAEVEDEAAGGGQGAAVAERDAAAPSDRTAPAPAVQPSASGASEEVAAAAPPESAASAAPAAERVTALPPPRPPEPPQPAPEAAVPSGPPPEAQEAPLPGIAAPDAASPAPRATAGGEPPSGLPAPSAAGARAVTAASEPPPAPRSDPPAAARPPQAVPPAPAARRPPRPEPERRPPAAAVAAHPPSSPPPAAETSLANPFAGLGPDVLVLGPGRAEGAVTRSATPLAQPRFVYPPESERRGEQGTVILLLHVDAEGRVAEVTLLSSSGYRALDRAAIEAARQWRFRPALRDGRPVGSTVRAPVTFRLQG